MNHRINLLLITLAAVLGLATAPSYATQILQQIPETGGDSFGQLTLSSDGTAVYFHNRRVAIGTTAELRIDGRLALRPQGVIAAIHSPVLVSQSRFVVGATLIDEEGTEYRSNISGENVFFAQNPSSGSGQMYPTGGDYISSFRSNPIGIARNGDILLGGGDIKVALVNRDDSCGCGPYICYATLRNTSNRTEWVSFSRAAGVVNYRHRDDGYISARYGIETGHASCSAAEPQGAVSPGPGPFFVEVQSQADGSDILYRLGPGAARKQIAQTGDYFSNLTPALVSVSENGTVAFLANFQNANGQGGSGIFSSTNVTAPRIAQGHRLGNATVGHCEVHGVADSGAVLTTCRLTEDGDPNNTSRFKTAVILASGGTDFPAPVDPPEKVTWATVDGNYATPDNWDVDAVPSGEQLAVFDRTGNYQVTFGGQRSAHQALIQRGSVGFSDGGYSLTDTGQTPASLRVNTSGQLTLTSGFQLESIHSRIGTAAGSGLIGLTDGGTQWTSQGRVSIGDTGEGKVALLLEAEAMAAETRLGDAASGNGILELESCANGTNFRTGNIAVGHAGRGELRVLGDTCSVASDFASMGFLPTASGFADIQGYWGVRDGIIVGDQGTGDVTLSIGGWIDGESAPGDPPSLSTIGFASGSEGVVRNQGGLLNAGTLVIGGLGRGELEISSGGLVQVALDTVIGNSSGSDGTVLVTGSNGAGASSGSSELEVNGVLRVGAAGVGSLTVSNNAHVIASGAAIAINDGADGEVVVDNAVLDVVSGILVGKSVELEGEILSSGLGRLNVRNGGIVVAPDGVTVDGPDSVISGSAQIAGNVLAINGGQVNPGNSPGTLTVDGEFTLDGGVLIVELSGTNAGEYDVLHVTGDTQLTGGTVRFVFQGYLPQTGDQISFLTADGAVSETDINYEYRGANEGFEFKIESDAQGRRTFVALNDAIDNLFSSGFE